MTSLRAAAMLWLVPTHGTREDSHMSLVATGTSLPLGAFARARQVVTIRSMRLACGLVLFSYVLTHLLNHALGNVSLDAMELGLDWVAWFWGLALPGFALYTALLIHAGLGLWAIYDRPRFAWRWAEALQLVLGLTIPFLLIGHVTGTRLANALFGATQSYAQLLYTFWVLDPARGVLQAVALLVTWIHGCLGLYFWLRLKSWFPRWGALLLCTAVLVLVLALLGYVQAGRAVLALAADQNWVVENAPVAPAQSEAVRAQLATIEAWRTGLYGTFIGGIGLGLAARLLRRLLERRHGVVRLR
jgi:adenylate cyclase